MKMVLILLLVFAFAPLNAAMHGEDWIRLGADVLLPRHVSVSTPSVHIGVSRGHYVSPRYNYPAYVPQVIHYRPPLIIEPVYVSPPRPQVIVMDGFPLYQSEPVKVVRHVIVERSPYPTEHRVILLINGNIRSYQFE